MGTKNRTPAHPGELPRALTWIDVLAARLISHAARTTPGHSAERLEEEWRAHCLELPAPTSRLKFALGCCRAAMVITRHGLGIANPVRSAPTGAIIMAAYAQRAIPLFSRQTHSDADDIVCEINTTPLIDIMLVLLITLIIALPLMTHGVMIDLPHGTPPVNQPLPEVIDLDIQIDGTVLWNGTALTGLQQLEDKLRAEGPREPQPEIRLRPSAHVRYDYVAKVLALAQRNQLKKIGFVNTASFED
jgi:biopolymer transport protein ExbD